MAAPSAPPAPPAAASDAEAAALGEAAFVWAAQHGLVVAAPAAGTLTHAPVALRPAAFPAPAYAQAVSLARPFGRLVAAVAARPAALLDALAPAAAHDPFTARLAGLLRAHPAPAGSLRLALLRSDYMVDDPTGRLLQVELNTVSASFAHLSQLVSAMHAALPSFVGSPKQPDRALPANAPGSGFAAALAAAHAAWLAQHGATQEGCGAAVLFVVQPGERNVFDQQGLQAALRDTHGVPTLRITLAQLAAAAAEGGGATLGPPPAAAAAAAAAVAPSHHNGPTPDPRPCLRLGATPVSVVYFRAGYTPDDFPSEAEWSARTLLERCSAVKCPDAAVHLAGAKKVQQHLAQPGALEAYVTDPQDAARLRGCFAGLWPLDGGGGGDAGAAAGLAAIRATAAADPGGYVLKPQREGGGNNVYGAALAARLADPDPRAVAGLGAYILMQRIRPRPFPALLMRAGAVARAEALCELGVYSVWLSRTAGGGGGEGGGEGEGGESVILNEPVGHLLRTKTADSDEGGVAAGFAVLDSPRLV